MEFGEWVQEIRRKKGIELRPLADKALVDASTISRIENLHTQATVYTAFRLCEALELDLSDLLDALTGTRLLRRQSLFPLETRFVARMQEVVSVVNEFETDREQAIRTMGKKLNDLLARYFYDVSGEDHLFGHYSSGEIERYFFSSPFSDEYNLKYPSINLGDILQIYEGNGVLMPTEVERYLKNIRGRSRSLPTSSIEKIKLPEFLGLVHKQLEGVDGRDIVGMIWEACKFLSTFGYLPQRDAQFDMPDFYISDYHSAAKQKEDDWKIRVAIFYVTLCRWELKLSTSRHI